MRNFRFVFEGFDVELQTVDERAEVAGFLAGQLFATCLEKISDKDGLSRDLVAGFDDLTADIFVDDVVPEHLVDHGPQCSSTFSRVPERL